MSELIRYLALIDLAILLVCGAMVRASYAPTVDRDLDVLALVFGCSFAAVAIGIGVNLLSPIPPTPGVKAYVIVQTPLALVALVLSVRALRHR